MTDESAVPAGIDPCGFRFVLRLQAAVEGECEGLAVSVMQAEEILAFALTGMEPSEQRNTAFAAILARPTLDATLSGQQGGAVPAGDLPEVHPGDLDDHDDIEKTITIVRQSYGWTLTDDGRLCGLVAGDMGYAATSIVIGKEHLDAWAFYNYRPDEDRLAEQPAPAPLSQEEQRDQAARCPCHGTDDLCPCQNVPDRLTKDSRARLAEQPAVPAGDADRFEGLRPGIEKALEIVETERETVSISSPAYQRLSSVYRGLRDALDGASDQGEG